MELLFFTSEKKYYNPLKEKSVLLLFLLLFLQRKNLPM